MQKGLFAKLKYLVMGLFGGREGVSTSNKHTTKNTILIIDDDRLNREMLKHIFSTQYTYEEAENGLEGLKKIEENQDSICAILLDVFMPVMSGIELLRILHSRGIPQRIPIFLITVSTDYELIKESYELGVMDVIAKPVAPFVILRRVQNLIELFQARETLSETVLGQEKQLKENSSQMDTLHRNMIEALAAAIEFRDVESGVHTSRMYRVTKHILANTEFGEDLSEGEIEDMAVASIMHDIGKIAISDVVLNKPGRLTTDEFEIMKTHTTKGAMLMSQILRTQDHASYKYACDIALHHHERWDGKGYPEGLKGDEISLWAQVVSIADVYDALLSPRVYKKAFAPEKAVKMIVNGECGVFNPKLLKSFLEVEPEIRKWYVPEEEQNTREQHKTIQTEDTLQEEQRAEKVVDLSLNREVIDVLLLMAAVKSVYDMIICVNLTKNNYYMIDYDRFLTHVAGYDGIFDDLIAAGASAVPKSHRELFTKTFCRESLLKAYQSGKKAVTLEHPQFADDGTTHMVSTSVLFVEDPKTEDILEITLSRYIDEEWEEREKNKRILSDALIVAEKANHAKSDFLSRMSHDIRTPLNAIIGMAAIIGANADNQQKIEECVGKIDISSKYLLSLINEILDFSKIESGSLSINETDFNMRKVAEEVKVIIEEKALEKKQKFEIFVDDHVAQYYKGDAFRIRQMLINLLDNACKYTEEGGAYSLHISMGEAVGTHRLVSFVVEDNGVGISKESVKEIFTPFVQYGNATENSGVGLGLAITRNLVHLMNGQLEVESTLGQGTKFTIEIPLEISQMSEAQAHKEETGQNKEEDKEILYSGQKILVAEDNELNQEIIKTILEMKNLQVDIAANGQEVVEKFTHSEPGEYRVIFMDVLMPVMNGYEATRQIRESVHEQAKTIPIYALTANAFYSDVMEAQNSGMNGHIAKPINFEELSNVLKKALVL